MSTVKELVEKLMLKGIYICYLVTDTKKNNEEGRLDYFEQEIGLELIKSDYYSIAESVYEILFKDKDKGDREYQLRLILNYALSREKQDLDYEDILRKEDLSIINPEHKLCMAAMRSNFEDVVVEFKRTTDQNDGEEFNFSQLLEWPVLSKFVEREDFISFIKKTYPNESEYHYPSDDFTELME